MMGNAAPVSLLSLERVSVVNLFDQRQSYQMGVNFLPSSRSGLCICQPLLTLHQLSHRVDDFSIYLVSTCIGQCM